MEIEKSFDESLKKSDLSDVVIDITESGLDSLLKNDVVKEIPIVRSIVGLTQLGVNIHDRMFLKKIISFLKNIDSVDVEERNKLIDSIDASSKYRLKVGEKLMYIIDSCDDHVVAERIAKLFSEFLKENISYDDYLGAASVIAKLSNADLSLFLDSYNVWFMLDDAKELTHTGLVRSEVADISVDLRKVEPGDWKDPDTYYEADVNGGEITIVPTWVGDIIYEVFGMGKKLKMRQIEDEVEERKRKRTKSRSSRIE